MKVIAIFAIGLATISGCLPVGHNSSKLADNAQIPEYVIQPGSCKALTEKCMGSINYANHLTETSNRITGNKRSKTTISSFKPKSQCKALTETCMGTIGYLQFQINSIPRYVKSPSLCKAFSEKCMGSINYANYLVDDFNQKTGDNKLKVTVNTFRPVNSCKSETEMCMGTIAYLEYENQSIPSYILPQSLCKALNEPCLGSIGYANYLIDQINRNASHNLAYSTIHSFQPQKTCKALNEFCLGTIIYLRIQLKHTH